MNAAFDQKLRLTVYRHFATTGHAPTATAMANHHGVSREAVVAGFQRLQDQHLLALEADGARIRMAPPFSAVPTQHRVVIDGVHSFANCAWDALGIVAALQRPGTVYSRCEENHQALVLEVGADGPPPLNWLFHCPVPASRWWENVVDT